MIKLDFRFLFVFILFLSSCAVGPNFHSPKKPQVASYTPTPLPKKTVSVPAAGAAGKSQTFVTTNRLPADWWKIFHSKELNRLIEAGLQNSPNLASAKAALIVAQENVNVFVGNAFYPKLTLPVTLERTGYNTSAINNLAPPSVFNLFNAGVNVTYTFDAFGGARRQLEALCAEVHYEWYQWQAAQLTLVSNIVTTAITIASLREQIIATKDLIRDQSSQLSILQKQFDLGGASQSDVLLQQTQVAQTEATLPPLQKALEQNTHALAALTGTLPGEFTLPTLNLEKLHLPYYLPVSIPSNLVKQRPDIQASIALLHAASAQIGVATANLYPQINLTGSFGYQDTTLGTLFQSHNKLWDVTIGITQPLFQGGALRAARRAAIANYKQAAAQYKQTVLSAFQNVADALRAVENDAKTFKAQKAAEISAQRSLVITNNQYKLGGVNYINLLTAQRAYQQARIARIQAQASRYTDTAALYQALGGGWWNRSCS